MNWLLQLHKGKKQKTKNSAVYESSRNKNRVNVMGIRALMLLRKQFVSTPKESIVSETYPSALYR